MNHLRIALCCLAGIAPAALQAQPNVATQSAVFIERAQSGVRSLEPASRLMRGDRVVTVVSWYRMGGQGDFTITNPLPRAIAYQASARDDQEVSVDGGKSWGRLGELKVSGRTASPEDVTHMRWRISRASTENGQLVYSGVVR